MNRYRLVLIAAGALFVLVRCVSALPPQFTTDEQRSFAAALLEFNPYAHQPPPPSYPVYVAAGKFVNFFVREPFATLLALSVISAVTGFVLFAIGFSRLIGATGIVAALAIYFSPPVRFLCAHPAPEPLAFACFAAALLFALRQSWWCGVAAALAAGAMPQMTLGIVCFILVQSLLRPATRDQRPATAAAFVVTLVIVFIPVLRNVRVDRLGWFIASFAEGHGAPLHDFLVQPWWRLTPVAFVLALAGLIIAIVRREGELMPLAAFTVVHFAYAVVAATSIESVRPFVPTIIGIACFATVSLHWGYHRTSPYAQKALDHPRDPDVQRGSEH